MTNVTIEKRSFENDKGDLIKYNALVVRGTINGVEQKVEKSVTNVEAMVIGMLLESDEQLHVENGGKGQEIEVKRKKKSEDVDFLDDLIS